MSTPLPKALKQLREAKYPEDVFGWVADYSLDDIKSNYRLLARIMHPDMHGGSKDAHDATALLNNWWDRAQKKFEQKRWGQKDSEVTIQTAKHIYKNVTELAAGDICDVYLAEQENGPRVVIKVSNPKDVDLVQNEARVLNMLWKPTDKAAVFTHQFLPKLIEQTKITNFDGKERLANVIEACEEGHTLEKIKEKYSNGLDPRHVAWIWKRLLEALTWIHEQGVVHGAIVPSHIFVYPKNHGLCILDWSYACTKDQRLKAVVSKYRDIYPPEITNKQTAKPKLDIYMIAQCMNYLLVGKDKEIPSGTPPMFTSMIRSCSLHEVYRSNDVREVHEQLTENLRKVYGPRKFVELEM